MRIISGRFKRRKLSIPSSSDVRPTTDRVREALYNWLASRMDLEGVRVLDLFAGSGALGFEALSRGAGDVTFVERVSKVADGILSTADLFGVPDEISVIRGDAIAWMARNPLATYDLILADPPYRYDAMADLADMALARLSEDGILVIEHGQRGVFKEYPALIDERQYGRSTLAYFSRSEP